MNPIPLTGNSCTDIVVQFLTGTIYSFLPQNSRPAVCRTETHGQLVLVALSPTVKGQEHDDDNFSLFSAEIGSCVCLPTERRLGFHT